MNTIAETFDSFSEEELTQIETMAGLFFKPEDIAIACDWPAHYAEQFVSVIECQMRNHILFKTYYKGRISAEIELRQHIKQAAANGSNPAQNTMLEFKENSVS